MEASGHGRWFERLLAELQIELWIGARRDPCQASTEAEDGSPGCALILRLLLEDRFPQIWVPS